MNFEFDPAKSESNKDKHGIDFAEARALWLDEKTSRSSRNHVGRAVYYGRPVSREVLERHLYLQK